MSTINEFYDSRSQYRRTPFIVVDNITTIGSWNRPSWMITRPNDKYIHKYIVPSSQQGRPDLIADAVYGLDSLDWVLITFNNVINVFGWPKSGEIISWPDSSIVIPSL